MSPVIIPRPYEHFYVGYVILFVYSIFNLRDTFISLERLTQISSRGLFPKRFAFLISPLVHKSTIICKQVHCIQPVSASASAAEPLSSRANFQNMFEGEMEEKKDEERKSQW